jgi:hypothetical protein
MKRLIGVFLVLTKAVGLGVVLLGGGGAHGRRLNARAVVAMSYMMGATWPRQKGLKGGPVSERPHPPVIGSRGAKPAPQL